jgi:uncharacterized membrane protein
MLLGQHRFLLGQFGIGLFDVVEGLIDHQILGIHHVKPGPHQLAWDLGFLALGAVLVIIGSKMILGGRRQVRKLTITNYELRITNYEH